MGLAMADASAQGIVKHDPPEGALWPGEIVFVDDRSCPPGQIKLVTAAPGPRQVLTRENAPRASKQCIDRPPAS